MTVLALALSFLILPLLAGPAEAASSGAIIVAADGASFVNMVLPFDPDLPEHYLEEALLEIIQEEGVEGIAEGDLISLDWFPQDPLIASVSGIVKLAAILARESERARSEGKKLIVVAHSWGTFLANAALGYATAQAFGEGQGFEPVGPVDLWIALGSPLGHRQVGFNPTELFLAAYVDYVKTIVEEELGPVPVPNGIGRIVNYWAWGDIISGPLKETPWLAGLGVEDHTADTELEGADTGLLRRTAANTVVWHYYDSLKSGGLKDNARLREAVAGLLKETLGD